MQSSASDNKRIAKNTLFLYLRMLITIVINLYIVRIIWKVLGVENYGIYNVVGGIVLMFAFITNSMVGATQRFISYELGRNDIARVKLVFNASLKVYIILSTVILIIAETLGLWFLNKELNIPEGRQFAANCVYQFSIISLIINMLSVPYNSCIIAHEHMNIYGYLGVLEVILKLGLVLLLIILPGDKLIIYALMITCISLFMRLLYRIYCKRNFEECNLDKTLDRTLLKNMFSFAGWTSISMLGYSCRDQGLNILINIFFNVSVNAAKGVANQIGSVINGFFSNFQLAMYPQITKSYAVKNYGRMLELVFTGCKFSGLLTSMITIPLMIAMDPILKLWLDNITPYTIGFCQLALILCLVEAISGPITASLQATGNIKLFQIVVGIIMLANLPISWIWLKIYKMPFVVMYVSIITGLIAVITRIVLLRKEVKFRVVAFFKDTILPIINTVVFSYICCNFIYSYFTLNIWGLLLFALCSIFISIAIIFILGLNRKERIFAINKIRQILSNN